MKKFIAITLVTFYVTEGLSAAESAAGTPPAKIANAVKESDLTTVTLTARAEQRLGIATVLLQSKNVPRTRLYGGEVVLPLNTDRGVTNDPAHSFFDGRASLNPPASPAEVVKLAESQTLADGEVQKAKVQVEAAQIAGDRADKLLRSETGSQRAVDEAQAALKLAQTAYDNAQARRRWLGPAFWGDATLDRAWVRVPVYVGDLSSLDPAKEARVGGIADRAGSPFKPGRLVAGPRSANAGAGTVDWFFEVENKNHGLRLGQRVGVTLARRGEDESLVVPWAAVLHDIHGGQWVYENTGPQTYIRRRVQVARVLGAEAVVFGGLKAGAKIVTAGAAELFGTEFGAGK